MLDIKNLKITTDHHLLDVKNHVTPYISIQLQKIYPDVLKGKKNVIDKLLKFISRYPKVPIFKNYLTTAYMIQGRKEKAYEANRWAVKEHPDYLFGKTNLANEYLDKEQPEKVPEVLGTDLNIQSLYPEREQFHEDEIMGFYVVVVRYFVEIEDFDQADILSQMLKEINTLHPKMDSLDEIITHSIMKSAKKRYEEEEAFRRTVPVIDRKKKRQTTIPPNFHYPEQIEYLYNSALPLPENKVKELLSLDPNKLAQDLQAVLKDSVDRFMHFNRISEEEGWDNEHFNAPIHSLLFLNEIRHVDNLNAILDISQQTDDYNNLWFGDIKGEIIISPIYHNGKDKLQHLANFVKEENISTYSKSEVTEAVSKIPTVEPKRRTEVLKWFENIIDYFIENIKNENLLDTDFIAFLVSDILEFQGKELLPKIKELFELEVVNYYICGTYEEIVKDIDKDNYTKSNDLFFSTSAVEKYEEYDKKWIQAQNAEANYNGNFLFPNALYTDNDYDGEPIVKGEKIGRNDSCPCGSGKKYKKCCLNTGNYE